MKLKCSFIIFFIAMRVLSQAFPILEERPSTGNEEYNRANRNHEVENTGATRGNDVASGIEEISNNPEEASPTNQPTPESSRSCYGQFLSCFEIIYKFICCQAESAANREAHQHEEIVTENLNSLLDPLAPSRNYEEKESYPSSLSPVEERRFRGASVVGFEEIPISDDKKMRVKILNLNRSDYPFLIRIEKTLNMNDVYLSSSRIIAADRYSITLNHGIDSDSFFEELKNSFSEAQLKFIQDIQDTEKYLVQFESSSPGEALPLDFFVRFEDAIAAYEKTENGSRIITSAPIAPAFGD